MKKLQIIIYALLSLYFSVCEAAPLIQLDQKSVNFGIHPVELTQRAKITIQNMGDQELRVLRILNPNSELLIKTSSKAIQPGKTANLIIEVLPNIMIGVYQKSIVLQTNSFRNPYIKIKFSGESKPLFLDNDIINTGLLTKGKIWTHTFLLTDKFENITVGEPHYTGFSGCEVSLVNTDNGYQINLRSEYVGELTGTVFFQITSENDSFTKSIKFRGEVYNSSQSRFIPLLLIASIILICLLKENKTNVRDILFEFKSFVLKNKIYTPILLCIISLTLYLTGAFQNKNSFQVHQWDHADYRIVAEHFWGIEHDYSTYSQEFSGTWGNFLKTVPFRQIAPGSFFLLSESITKGIFGKDAPVGPMVSTLLIFGLICSVTILYYFSAKTLNHSYATLFCSLLIFPPWQWITTEELLSEAFLRILMIVILSFLLTTLKRALTNEEYIFFIIVNILCVHVKTQWILIAAACFPIIFLHHTVINKKPIRTIILQAFLTLLIPISLLAVNYLGWKDNSVVSGVGMHINRKTKTEAIQYARKNASPENTFLFNKTGTFSKWWKMNIPESFTISDYKEFEKLAKNYVKGKPETAIKNCLIALESSTNFPTMVYRYQAYPKGIFIGLFIAINYFCWAMLILGFFHKSTRILCCFGLVLWITPMIGNIFGGFTERYFWPMAGIPLVLSIIVAKECLSSKIKILLERIKIPSRQSSNSK